MGLSFLAEVQVGGYVSALKTIPVILVLLLWTRLLTWVDKDAPAAHLPRTALNSAFVGGLIVAFALLMFIPGYVIAFPVFLFIMLVEAGAYLGIRNSKVGLGDLHDQFGPDCLQLGEKPGTAGEDLGCAGILVQTALAALCELEVLHCVRDVHG